jgi:hypothetical protein
MNDLTKQQQTWDRLWEKAQDYADGGPAIIRTVEGKDFIWDGVRWLIDPDPQT